MKVGPEREVLCSMESLLLEDISLYPCVEEKGWHSGEAENLMGGSALSVILREGELQFWRLWPSGIAPPSPDDSLSVNMKGGLRQDLELSAFALPSWCILELREDNNLQSRQASLQSRGNLKHRFPSTS